MPTPPINTQLIDSLAQVILALNAEEQELLVQKVQRLRAASKMQTQLTLDQFFQDLETLEPDPQQPTLQDISQEVKAARHELWKES